MSAWFPQNKYYSFHKLRFLPPPPEGGGGFFVPSAQLHPHALGVYLLEEFLGEVGVEAEGGGYLLAVL